MAFPTNPALEAAASAEWWRVLVAAPTLKAIRDLSVVNVPLSAEGSVALAGAEHLKAVRRLFAWCPNGGGPFVGDPFDGPWAAGLREVTLSCGLGPTPWPPGLGRLTHLRALDVDVAHAGVVGQVAAAEFPALSALRLNVWAPPYLSGDGLAVLMRADWFARLRSLDFPNNGIDDGDLAALACHPVATSLRVLRLAKNPAIGEDGLWQS